MHKIVFTLLILIFIALLGGGIYWYLYVPKEPGESVADSITKTIFSPFNRATLPTDQPPVTQLPETPVVEQPPVQSPTWSLPKLRQLSATPVGGMYASSTASSSLVRFVDRGTGHVYEASTAYSDIQKISNTTIPKIYETYWNKNLSAFIARSLQDDSDAITNFYADLRKAGTSTSETPFEVKGKYLSANINQIAYSPAANRIATWNIENGRGVAYLSGLDEAGKVKIADTPLTQVVLEWPETNTLSLTTKASAVASGYLYTIDTKTGIMKKALGGLRGLSAKVSGDVSRTIYSSSVGTSFQTSLYNLKDFSRQDVIFKTLADKCIWSTLRKNEVYCAVPTEIPSATYPDDWYKGSVHFVDQIWHLDTTTGEVHLLANLLDLSDKLIDAIQLTLDPKENMLYFINKRDLSLWSLDLTQ